MQVGKEAAVHLLIGLLSLGLTCGCAALKPNKPQPSALRADSAAPVARAAAEPVPDDNGNKKAAPSGQVQLVNSTAGPSARPAAQPAGPPESNPAARMRFLYQRAASTYSSVDSYIVRLRRREEVNGKAKPEETLLVKFRKNPWSIYFKWLGPAAQGREVLFVNGRFDNKLHTLLAAGDVPLMPAGRQMSFDPDSPLVRGSSRHSIREAGVGHLIEKFGRHLDSAEKPGSGYGTMRYLGYIKRPEYAKECEAVEEMIPPGADALLPKGGRRLWVFDQASTFPVLVVTQNETGREVEYYCYDRFLFPVRLDDADFDPSVLWKPKPRSGSLPD
jgi:hypothetical protein